MTFLCYACKRGYLECVKVLIKTNIDLDIKFNNKTLLMLASIKGYDTIVETLIDAGAKIYKTKWYYFRGFIKSTPLTYTLHYKHTEVIKILKDAEKILKM